MYDSPGSTYSVGWARYVLERRYGQQTTAVRAASLGRITLSNYDVIIFPSGNYRGAVGGGLVQRLQNWMREGGTVITIGESSRWATQEGVGLLATRAERRGGRPEGSDAARPGTAEQPISYWTRSHQRMNPPSRYPGQSFKYCWIRTTG